MSKNVVNFISLLSLVIILVLSSCTSSRKYSYRSKSKTRTERPRSVTAHAKKKRTHNYAAHSTRNQIVHTAKKYIGKSYQYGGKKPSTGFDCSGFTSHVFNDIGINVSGPSHQQAKQGRKKSKRELEIGDLVFFGNNNRVSHVAIVADVNRNSIKVIHSTSSRGVVVDDITASAYWQKRYLFGRDVLN